MPPKPLRQEEDNQPERAGEPLPYTLAELRAVVAQALSAGTCPYCAGQITVASYSIDHLNPISRDGDFSIGNIVVCDLRCNKIKGNLIDHEFLRLTGFLAEYPPEVAKDMLARLYGGGLVRRR
jgi:5-methylcytosine-specific restriction endonuclease McrA